MSLHPTLASIIAVSTGMEPMPEGKMLHEGEVVDAFENCDGTDDGYYACTYPPCVAEREAEGEALRRAFFAEYPKLRQFVLEDHEPGDPKAFDLDEQDV